MVARVVTAWRLRADLGYWLDSAQPLELRCGAGGYYRELAESGSCGGAAFLLLSATFDDGHSEIIRRNCSDDERERNGTVHKDAGVYPEQRSTQNSFPPGMKVQRHGIRIC